MDNHYKVLDKQKFWSCIEYLYNIESDIELDLILNELEVSEEELLNYITFLNDLGCNFKVRQDKLVASEKQNDVKIEFDFLTWLKFQAHFPFISEASNKVFHESVLDRLSDIEKSYDDKNLYTALEKYNYINNKQKLELVSPKGGLSIIDKMALLEESILDKSMLSAKLEGKTIKLAPYKIVFLDSHLSVVAKNLNNKCLCALNIETIDDITCEEESFEEEISILEINDFIASMREASGKSVRLVLKLHSQESFHSEVDYHYFENQCMFANNQGEHIWAATIEPNERVYSWLSSLEGKVEILDPVDFKKDYLSYCEEQLKKIA